MVYTLGIHFKTV